MKNEKLLLALLLAVASTAHAQSSVTLYGVIDDGLSFTSNQGGHTSAQINSNTTFGDRWGLKGSEDLGGGLAAIFTLENGFDPNTGAAIQGNRLFGRQAFVGLSSNFGAITFGRQYDTPVDYVSPLSLVFTYGAYGGHPADNDNLQGGFRVNNSVKVRSAVYGGISAEAMYAFSNNAEGFNQNRLWSLATGFNGGPISLAAAVSKLDLPASNTTGAVGGSGGNTTSDYVPLAARFVSGPINSQLSVYGAAMYAATKWSASAVYSHVQYDANPSRVTFDNYEVDGIYHFTPSLLFAATYTFTNGDVAISDLKPKYHQVDLMLDYSLSKRTDVYLMLVGQKAIHTFAQIYANTASSNDKQGLARLGMRVRF